MKANVIMGFRDNDFPDPMQLFSPIVDLRALDRLRVSRRLQSAAGRALTRIDQVDAFYDDLEEEPSVRLEYDRFNQLPFESHHVGN